MKKQLSIRLLYSVLLSCVISFDAKAKTQTEVLYTNSLADPGG